MPPYCRVARSAVVIPSDWTRPMPGACLRQQPGVTTQSSFHHKGQPVSYTLGARRFRMPKAEQPSLYERLGGVYSIATVVDDFINRVMIDPRLNANPRVNEAHHRVPAAGFKYLVTEMVCWAAGGPQKYTGRSMKDSHLDLMITAVEWEAFLDDLQQTLDKFAVPQTEQGEIKAIVASTRADIVV